MFKTLEELNVSNLTTFPKFAGDEGCTAKDIKKFGCLVPIKNTKVGVEVEVENMPTLNKKVKTKDNPKFLNWEIGHDPSLRNNGVELQCLPCTSDSSFAMSLSQLDAVLEAYPDHDFSFRTSIHIHLDVRKFTIASLFVFHLIYIFLEGFLFKRFSESRHHSEYCVPLSDSGLILVNNEENGSAGLRAAFKAAYLKQKDTLTWHKSMWEMFNKNVKYSAVNYSRLLDLGTIEFRHLGGTSDMQHIRMWVSTLVGLIEYSLSHEMKEVADDIHSITNPKETLKLLKKIFPYKELLEYLVNKNVDETILLLFVGVKMAKTFFIRAIKKSEAVLTVTPTGSVAKVAKEIKDKKLIRLMNSF